jgi:hypothetical protein
LVPERIVQECYALQPQGSKGQEKDRAKSHQGGDHQEGDIFGGSVPCFDRRMRDAESVYEHESQVAQQFHSSIRPFLGVPKCADVAFEFVNPNINRIRSQLMHFRESRPRYTSLGIDSRSVVLARDNLAFVAATEIPKAWAISFVEHSFA